MFGDVTGPCNHSSTRNPHRAWGSSDANRIRLLAKCAWTMHLPLSPGDKRAPKGREKLKNLNLQLFLFWSHGQAVLHLNSPWSNLEKVQLGSAPFQVLHQGSPKAAYYRDVLFYAEFFLHLGQRSSVIPLCMIRDL